jgi:hypothetical protein
MEITKNYDAIPALVVFNVIERKPAYRPAAGFFDFQLNQGSPALFRLISKKAVSNK